MLVGLVVGGCDVAEAWGRAVVGLRRGVVWEGQGRRPTLLQAPGPGTGLLRCSAGVVTAVCVAVV